MIAVVPAKYLKFYLKVKMMEWIKRSKASDKLEPDIWCGTDAQTVYCWNI